MDEQAIAVTSLPSIKEFGRIMQDAFEGCTPNNGYCTYLDGQYYTVDDFSQFNKELKDFTLVIEGGGESLVELEDFTFLGDFILCFKEGQQYKEDVARASSESEELYGRIY